MFVFNMDNMDKTAQKSHPFIELHQKKIHPI